VIALLRLLLPPHPDNEKAADFLRVNIGQRNPYIEWCAVRPDTLINEENVTGYSLHISPTRSALFNPGKTSRINVGHFMARLILDDDIWNKWKGQMPVIYNEPEHGK
jgi:L-rhamnose mutarotase